MARYEASRQFRLELSQMEALETLAMAANTKSSTVMRQLIPKGHWVEILANEITCLPGGKKSIFDGMASLMADGLIRKMQQHKKPIDSYFIENLTPDGVAEYFLQFLEAVKYELGITNAQSAQYHFDKPPLSGHWGQAGVTGWGVLPMEHRYVKSGIAFDNLRKQS